MSLSELLSQLQALPRPEKWRLTQLLVADLASEERTPSIDSDHPYPVWSPYHAFDAAEAMLNALKAEAEDKPKSGGGA